MTERSRGRAHNRSLPARSKPLKRGKFKARGKGLRTKAKIRRYVRIRPLNPDRKKKLYAEQFGPKGDVMRGMCCVVTGDDGSGYWPVDLAHVGRTRSAESSNRMLAPLRRDVHHWFDTQTDQAFEEKWLTTKRWVRDWARAFDREYRARSAEAAA